MKYGSLLNFKAEKLWPRNFPPKNSSETHQSSSNKIAVSKIFTEADFISRRKIKLRDPWFSESDLAL